MGFKDEVANDLATFFNANEFAEPVIYNGVSINVIPNLGSDLEDGNIVSLHGTSARAVFYVRAADVPEPLHGDQIEYNNEVWTVVQKVYSKAGIHKVACTGRESVY